MGRSCDNLSRNVIQSPTNSNITFPNCVFKLHQSTFLKGKATKMKKKNVEIQTKNRKCI